MTLDNAQALAVVSKSKKILVVAGPGSGKTRVIIERIRQLITTGTYPGNIVCITFTNEAAREIERRLAWAFPQESQAKMRLGYCGTLHSFMLRIIREYGDLIGLRGAIAICDEEQRAEIISKSIERNKFKGPRQAVEKEISAGLPRKGILTALEIVVADYYQTMRAAGMLDFDAILLYGREILKKGVQLPFSDLFVDEIQDSSDIDFEIYDLLDIDNKFFCGDPDQGIYSFRGGTIDGIIRLSQRDDVEVLKLENNYRSGEGICLAAQRMIALNEKRLDKQTIAVTTDPAEVEITIRDTPAEEVAYIARVIAERKPATAAVLVRTNPLAKMISTGLMAHGIEVSRKEIEDVPPDWKNARLLIGLLSNPFSDVLARMFLARKEGDGLADKVATLAAKKMISINEMHFAFAPTTNLDGQLETTLRLQGISAESQARIMEYVKSLAPGSTMVDLNFALGRDLQHRDEVGKGVVVTTMHSSKGREWHTVFLPAFEQEIIPGGRKDVNIEEERRLAYVAMTRAERTLIVMSAKGRATEWSRKLLPATPSQFGGEALIDLVSNR